jgi:BASS family bile acid:Na+ symporter
MKTIIDLGIVLVNILMMLAVGLDLELRHFQQVARQKRALILSLAASSILLPLLGVALTHLLSLPSHISAGILLLAACPNGDIVNFYTLLARANVALAVTTTVISLGCISHFIHYYKPSGAVYRRNAKVEIQGAKFKIQKEWP